LQDYKKDVRLERNIQPLSDDYIKFIRFAQWKIEQSGMGIVAFITNNSYLDGIIHRGMRKKIIDTFDLIYIFNLHGSTRRIDTSTNTETDQNVFDIQLGVCISFFIKLKDKLESPSILYTEIKGKREKKFAFLNRHSISDCKWITINAKGPNYFFIPKTNNLVMDTSVSLNDIFYEKSTGVKTHRDKFIVDSSKEDLINRLKKFISNNNIFSNDFLMEEYNLKNTKDWTISQAREKFQQQQLIEDKFRKYHYRPFDIRWIYLSSILVTRSRGKIISNISESNIAIVTTRQIASKRFNHVFVTDILPDICIISDLTKESSYVFPMFYMNKGMLKSNVKDFLLNALSNHFARNISGMEVIAYIYAILNSNIYRKNHSEELLSDFPKIPFTNSKKMFDKLVEYGNNLINLHLLKDLNDMTVAVTYPIQGSDLVDFVKYNEKEKRVYINNNQYFSNIKNLVWDYQIGSFFALKKWLNGKIRQHLTIDDVSIFQNIVYVIEQTIIIRDRIDYIYIDAMNGIISIPMEHKNNTLVSVK
jgi:predicted helicase